MKVICFYWQGDRWQQPGYKQEEGHVNLQQEFMDHAGTTSIELASKYVNNLYQGVKKYADRVFEFICFTNEPLSLQSGISICPFELLSISGVLPRLFMFSKEAGLFGHQVLCLDIDVVVVGSLKQLMNYEGLFCTRAKFKLGEQHKIDGDIMSFRAGKETEDLFWKPFIADVQKAEEETQGRERYWIRGVTDNKADLWDKESVVSYKRHVRKAGRLPKGAVIVSCHGIPRPHEIKDNWIKQYWK